MNIIRRHLLMNNNCRCMPWYPRKNAWGGQETSLCPTTRASVCYSTIQSRRQQNHNQLHCVNLSSIMADNSSTNKGCINTSAVKSSTGCVITMLRISCIVSVSVCMLIHGSYTSLVSDLLLCQSGRNY